MSWHCARQRDKVGSSKDGGGSDPANENASPASKMVTRGETLAWTTIGSENGAAVTKTTVNNALFGRVLD